jgi:hypothetical protein
MNTKQQSDLLKAWYQAAMQSCFPETDGSFKLGAGFSNPVGQAFQQAMTAILSGLADGSALSTFHAPLDRIVRVLAVQGLPSGVAIRFLFVLRNQLGNMTELTADEKKYWTGRLDDLAEIAVEIWCECRETLSQLRINELRNRIQLLEADSAPKERGGVT